MLGRISDTPQQLRLAGTTPVRRGGHRNIFEHPLDDGALVKIERQEVVARKSRLKQWLFRYSRSYRLRAPRRELIAFRTLQAAGGVHPSFLSPVLAVAETDLGAGVVVGKMRGRDGRLAPEIWQVIRAEGMSERMRDHVRVFCEALFSGEAIVSDLKLSNILLAYDDANGDRLVLVDGLGEKTLVPVNRISRSLSRRSLSRQIHRMMAQIEACASRASSKGSAKTR